MRADGESYLDRRSGAHPQRSRTLPEGVARRFGSRFQGFGLDVHRTVLPLARSTAEEGDGFQRVWQKASWRSFPSRGLRRATSPTTANSNSGRNRTGPLFPASWPVSDSEAKGRFGSNALPGRANLGDSDDCRRRRRSVWVSWAVTGSRSDLPFQPYTPKKAYLIRLIWYCSLAWFEEAAVAGNDPSTADHRALLRTARQRVA
jgi:hypothetical protein